MYIFTYTDMTIATNNSSNHFQLTSSMALTSAPDLTKVSTTEISLDTDIETVA